MFSLAQGYVILSPGADPQQLPQKFCITAEYEYGLDREVTERHIVDLRPYLNSDVPQDVLIRKMSDLLEAINKLASNGKDR